MADLTKLYATQITTLHSNIEGSAKFVPPLAGRHVVTEVENMWSLNAATYKVEYAVHFVLLDDALLVAKRRKRRTGEGGKLVAERCWQLGEINVVDVKDSLGTPSPPQNRTSSNAPIFQTSLAHLGYDGDARILFTAVRRMPTRSLSFPLSRRQLKNILRAGARSVRVNTSGAAACGMLKM